MGTAGIVVDVVDAECLQQTMVVFVPAKVVDRQYICAGRDFQQLVHLVIIDGGSAR